MSKNYSSEVENRRGAGNGAEKLEPPKDKFKTPFELFSLEDFNS